MQLPANTKIEYKYVILEEQVRESAPFSLCNAHADLLISYKCQMSASLKTLHAISYLSYCRKLLCTCWAR